MMACCAKSMCEGVAPTCLDGCVDGDETDIDCGGGKCNPCALGKTCHVASDCYSGVCKNDVCVSCVTDGECPLNDCCYATAGSANCVPKSAGLCQ
jgi:hypothetical protein